MRSQCYLRYKSSQVAAAALTLAVNLSCTKLVEGLDADQITQAKRLFLQTPQKTTG